MATLARPGCILRRIPGTGFSPVPCTARHRAKLHQLCLTVCCWLGIARLGLRQGRFPNFLLDALSTSQAKSGHCSRPQKPPACGLTIRRSLAHTGQCRRVGDICKNSHGLSRPAAPAKTWLCESLWLFLGWFELGVEA